MDGRFGALMVAEDGEEFEDGLLQVDEVEEDVADEGLAGGIGRGRGQSSGLKDSGSGGGWEWLAGGGRTDYSWGSG
ncbi:MAG: hypothetical protein OXG65_09475 [Chloroflexi bacterium]|nr:hypothetical protein [Chloroflexota bacterium]